MPYQAHSTVVAASGSPATAVLTLNSVQAGEDIIVLVSQASARTSSVYSASSNIDGSFGSAVVNSLLSLASSQRGGAILRKKNATAGNHTITVTIDASSTAFDAVAIRVSGLDQSASPITASFDDGSTGLTHYAAAAGSIDVTPDCFIAVAGALPGTVTTRVAGTSPVYTQITPVGAQTFFQYRDATGPVVDDRGTWTTTGTQRQALSTMAAFPLASAPPASPRIHINRR